MMKFLDWLVEYRKSLKRQRLSKNMIEAFNDTTELGEDFEESKGPFVIYKFDVYKNEIELGVFQKSQDLHSSILDFANWIRNQVKHGEDNPRTEHLSEVQDMFWECIDGNLEQ